MEFMVNDALAYLKAAQRVLRCAGGGNERDEAVAAALDAIEPIIAKLTPHAQPRAHHVQQAVLL